MRVFTKIIAAFVVIFSIQMGRATHIVGGEMTYQYKGNNQYTIRLDLYIDCINGSIEAIRSDAQAIFGVFNGNSRRILSGYPISVNRSGPQRVQKTNYNCLKITPNACVDHYWYERTLTLPPTAGGYYVSFQRCCRNGSITNIISPGATGANYWAYIPNANTISTPNSSPVFKELPPNFLCTNTPLIFDHSASDADGDSLAYELITPYTGGDVNDPRPDNAGNGNLEEPFFSQIIFGSGYSATNPIDGSPAINIDPKTGLLTLTPTKVGQFVLGISVKEYRNKVLIATTFRDYQFNVQSCQIDVAAAFFTPKVICDFTYRFQNLSKGATKYKWDFGVVDETNDTSNVASPSFTFPKPGKYKVKLIAFSTCKDSFEYIATVLEPAKPKLPDDTIICLGKTVTFKSDIVGTSYLWNDGSIRDSLVVSNSGMYILGVSQDLCTWYDTVNVSVDTDKVNAIGDTVFCSDASFTRSLTALFPNAGTCKWSTNETTNTISVNSRGRYSVVGTTTNGCISYDTVTIDQFPPVIMSVNDTIICPGTSALITAVVNNPTADVQWSNGTSGRVLNTSTVGKYRVTATVGKCSVSQTIELLNFARELELGNDLRFCDKIDTLISLSSKGYKSVIWNSEVVGSTFQLTSPGILSVRITTQNGCIEQDSIRVMLFPNPYLDLGSDTVYCLSEKPVLDAGSGMMEYKWNTGESTQKIIAHDSGMYVVQIVDFEGCRFNDTINIKKKKDLFPSSIYMPNAFTPNDDGLNDLYPANQYKVKGALYNVKLYNRWGEKLGDYNTPDANWDGKINGNPAPEGVYVFKINWIGCDNNMRTLVGDFTLLR